MSDARPVTPLPADREVTLRVIPMPADANHTGDMLQSTMSANRVFYRRDNEARAGGKKVESGSIASKIRACYNIENTGIGGV